MTSGAQNGPLRTISTAPTTSSPRHDGLIGQSPMRAQFEDPEARRPALIVAARWGAGGTPFQKLVQRRHLGSGEIHGVGSHGEL